MVDVAHSPGNAGERPGTSGLAETVPASRRLTLENFNVPIPLTCFHCAKKFVKASTVELNCGYVTVQCRSCGCMTPFKVQGKK